MSNNGNSGNPTRLTCIVCPQGCKLLVDKVQGQWSVTREKCSRGRAYALQEMTQPQRNLTTSIRVERGESPLASVRLSGSISKDRMEEAMESLKNLRVEAPLQVGQVIAENLLGLGVDVLVTRGVSRRQPG